MQVPRLGPSRRAPLGMTSLFVGFGCRLPHLSELREGVSKTLVNCEKTQGAPEPLNR